MIQTRLSPHLTYMQDAQETHMFDECNVLEWNVDKEDIDGYGIPVEGYRVRLSTKCGLKMISPKEIQASGEVPVILGKLRLPLATIVETRDRISVTHRYGTELAEPLIFDIEGPVERGPTGLVVLLRTLKNERGGVQ